MGLAPSFLDARSPAVRPMVSSESRSCRCVWESYQNSVWSSPLFSAMGFAHAAIFVDLDERITPVEVA